ncbi:hypothetical protein [Nocardioides rubriscoriae]|uniref:hypothetical protein n=1 Tax=Nocardioides rubriscoriae TaxID=642762 RepID=UPI0011DF32E8|nr:hypothetical protein [Nocardioides rubriscoriae]
MRLSRAAVALAFVVISTVGGYAAGHSTQARSAPVPVGAKACLTARNVLVLARTDGTCPRRTTKAVLGSRGPRGVRGPAGPTGPQGPGAVVVSGALSAVGTTPSDTRTQVARLGDLNVELACFNQNGITGQLFLVPDTTARIAGSGWKGFTQQTAEPLRLLGPLGADAPVLSTNAVGPSIRVATLGPALVTTPTQTVLVDLSVVMSFVGSINPDTPDGCRVDGALTPVS